MCDKISRIQWGEIPDITSDQRAFHVAANAASPSVWIVSQEDHASGGYRLAELSETGWNLDESQEKGAVSWELAVDKDGYPAFLDAEDKVHWKKNGKWTELDGCAYRIAFGGDGSFYKRDCTYPNYIFKYSDLFDKWEKYSQEATEYLSVDLEGILYLGSFENGISR